MSADAIVLSFEVSPHGPQWQRKLRFSMGERGRMKVHGTAYCSAEFAGILQRMALLAAQQGGVELTIITVDDLSGEPTFQSSRSASPERMVTEDMVRDGQPQS